jgi:hypothetical protein
MTRTRMEYRVVSIRPSDRPARLSADWRPLAYLSSDIKVFVVFRRKAPGVRRKPRGK